MPILVVGNHGDPFTSFRESETLATETLANGYLLETTIRAMSSIPTTAASTTTSTPC